MLSASVYTICFLYFFQKFGVVYPILLLLFSIVDFQCYVCKFFRGVKNEVELELPMKEVVQVTTLTDLRRTPRTGNFFSSSCARHALCFH